LAGRVNRSDRHQPAKEKKSAWLWGGEESGITAARAASAPYEKGIIFEAKVGQPGTVSIIIEDDEPDHAKECVTFLQTIRRLLTSMQKINTRAWQQS
jgi:hypothetical protein